MPQQQPLPSITPTGSTAAEGTAPTTVNPSMVTQSDLLSALKTPDGNQRAEKLKGLLDQLTVYHKSQGLSRGSVLRPGDRVTMTQACDDCAHENAKDLTECLKIMIDDPTKDTNCSEALLSLRNLDLHCRALYSRVIVRATSYPEHQSSLFQESYGDFMWKWNSLGLLRNTIYRPRKDLTLENILSYFENAPVDVRIKKSLAEMRAQQLRRLAASEARGIAE